MNKNLEKQLRAHLECLQQITGEDLPKAERAATLLLIDAQEHHLEPILDPLGEQIYSQVYQLKASISGMEMILTALLNLAETEKQ